MLSPVAKPSAALARSNLQIRFSDSSDREALQRMNARLMAGGRQEQLPLDPQLPGESANRSTNLPVHRRLLIATDGEEVRAGMMLLHSTIAVHGQERRFCWMQLPVSEGLVNRRYSLAIVKLVRQALQYQPMLLELGVGSLDEDWSRFMISMGWRHAAVPFVFFPVQPTRVLQSVRFGNQRFLLRTALHLTAHAGGGEVLRAYLTWRRRTQLISSRRNRIVCRREPLFGSWATALYRRHCSKYGGLVKRDAETLNILYSESDERWIRLRVDNCQSKETVGWLVALVAEREDDKYFGNLRVGVLVDGFAAPVNAAHVLRVGLEHLIQCGAELVVANWSHQAWLKASRQIGFLPGPTNYFLFAPVNGNPLLEDDCPLSALHLTRGDCDGPTYFLG